MMLDNETYFLPDDIEKSIKDTSVNGKRRSFLYMPLNKTRFFSKIEKSGADAIIFDLEDSIPYSEKDNSRKNLKLIPNKLEGLEYFLRVNDPSTKYFESDLNALPKDFDGLMIPKIGSPEIITHIRPRCKSIIALIETIQGIDNIDHIAKELSQSDILAFGAGDLSTEFGIERLPLYESPSISYSLYTMIKAAKKYHVQPIDTPFRGFINPDLLRKETDYCKQMGVQGKQAIHPSQIKIINEAFYPSEMEVAKYVNMLTIFYAQKTTQTVRINESYEGKPSMLLAMQKLKEFYSRGFIK